jgi:hypothetical protein
MKTITTDIRSAAIISFVLVLPFVVLEFLFNNVNKQNALGLTLLFGLLWLLPLAFVVSFGPVVRSLWARGRMMNPANLLLRVAFSAFVAMVWGVLLLDQLPCFIGVPNCD